jgi:26S proteasome regulatory subunit N11
MERLQRMLGAGGGMGGAGAGVGDAPQQDTSEQIYISSLALLKMLKHGRAGVPLEVMGLMLGEFVDEFTVKVVDVFAMPQSGTGVSVEAVDPVFQTKMLDMLKQTGRWVRRWGLQGRALPRGGAGRRWRLRQVACGPGPCALQQCCPCICCCIEITGLSASPSHPRLHLSAPPCRPEMVVGWYHSHPGFGCWLSGVDVNTQQSFEALNQRAVAGGCTH